MAIILPLTQLLQTTYQPRLGILLALRTPLLRESKDCKWSRLTQERFQTIQKSLKGSEEDPGPAPLLQLILWLRESGPELRHHCRGQVHLQRLQEPDAQQLAEALTTQQGPTLGETLVRRRAAGRHLKHKNDADLQVLHEHCGRSGDTDKEG